MKHHAWDKFEPNNLGLKDLENYLLKIANEDIQHIPKEVIAQWILPHFHEPNSDKNYGWIDLDNVIFEIVELEMEEIEKINVIEVNQTMIKEYSVSNFAYWHRKYWKKMGTWEVPPILIDVESFIDNKPKTSEMEGNLQLVEGHNRLATLLMLRSEGLISVLDKHRFYIMKSTA